jgi:hypothetical protein
MELQQVTSFKIKEPIRVKILKIATNPTQLQWLEVSFCGCIGHHSMGL